MALRINIEPVKDEEFLLEASPADTVHDIKMRIGEKTAVPADKQRLVFTVVEMGDDQSLDECHIVDHSVIYLVTTATKLWVILHNGQLVTVDMSPLDTVAMVKMQIKTAVGLTLPHRRFNLAFDGMILDDDAIINSEDIPEMAVLGIVTPGVISMIIVFPEEKQMAIRTNLHDTTETLHDVIASHLLNFDGLQPEINQIEMYHERRKLDGSLTVADNNLADGDVIRLSSRSTIKVKVKALNSEVYMVDVCPEDTKRQFLHQIPQGTSLQPLRFMYEGRVLELD